MLKSEKFDKKENRFCHAFSRDFDFQHCLLKTDFWSGILILPYLITIVYSSAFKVLPCHDSNNPCVNGATCIDVNGAAICACTEGYNGRFCQVSPCDESVNPCVNGATCTEVESNAVCTCADGFVGLSCERGA
jgi:hypothetical protein